MNYCIVAFFIVLVISVVQWIFDGSRNFKGPQVELVADENEAYDQDINQDPGQIPDYLVKGSAGGGAGPQMSTVPGELDGKSGGGIAELNGNGTTAPPPPTTTTRTTGAMGDREAVELGEGKEGK